MMRPGIQSILVLLLAIATGAQDYAAYDPATYDPAPPLQPPTGSAASEVQPETILAPGVPAAGTVDQVKIFSTCSIRLLLFIWQIASRVNPDGYWGFKEC